MSVCAACGSLLETLEYQSRAADEAHRTVDLCPYCPVDPSKLNMSSAPKSPHIPLKGHIRHFSLPLPIAIDSSRVIRTIYIDIPSHHEYQSLDLTLMDVTSTLLISKRRDSLHSRENSAGCHNRDKIVPTYKSNSGLMQSMFVKYHKSTKIGIGLKLKEYSVYNSYSYQLKEKTDRDNIVRGMFVNIDNIQGFKSYIYCSHGKSKRKLIIELGFVSPERNILEQIVNTAYNNGLLPKDVYRYMDKNKVTQLMNLSSRAFDTNMPPQFGYTFTCKPDGERKWIVWTGYIWYIFNPRFHGGALNWIWSDTMNNKSYIIADVEYLPSVGFILIDFLTDENGSSAPTSRDLDWVAGVLSALEAQTSKIPLHVRRYFHTYNDAAEYSKTVGYPTDGVVAIRNGSTEILKIKDIKSMELRYYSDGTFKSEDGIIVTEVKDEYNFSEGDIVEIRFRLLSNNTIQIFGAFKRVDKSMANTANVIGDIIRSSNTNITADDNDRRAALIWCNELRSYLMRSAVSVRPEKVLIIDVGTGTGQSLDSLALDESVSYILIEPDTERCNMIARRLKAAHIYKSLHEIIPILRALRTRTIQSVIFNCTLAEILESKESDILFNEAKAVTCTFSMHFVVKDLHQLYIKYKVPIYGCGYLYDGTDNKGILVKQCGVEMKIVEDGNGYVKWGGDKSYTEPVTRRRDYSGLGIIALGRSSKPLPDSNIAPGAFNICRHVYTLTP
jgi:hypothetical protein